jgi:multiple sugar transport system ATP-binding protein
MAEVSIRGLRKSFGKVEALKGIDLDIAEGEFCVLVGPSGCGKTTLLRTIAGLEDANEGTISIAGEVVNDLRPRDRNVAMVFQSYALYPYLNVYDNIAFGLKARRVPAAEIRRKVATTAEMLGITPLLDRTPRQLSGGQRQRVAIGRAVVRDARIFLFDEPLSNLDAQLRDGMRAEIKRLHQEIGKTMIYVTHDQIEAMTLADRMVLFNEGKIEQQGEPLQIFERPQTWFVAGFLGSPRMNFVPCALVGEEGRLSLAFEGGETLPLNSAQSSGLAGWRGRKLVLGIRPQHLSSADGRTEMLPGEARMTARVELVQPTGTRTYVQVRFGGAEVTAELPAHSVQRPGTPVDLVLDMSRAILIDPDSGQVLPGGNGSGRTETMAGGH